MKKSAHVFVSPNPDGSFTVGKEDRTHTETIRVDALALVDLIWCARRALRLAKAADDEDAVSGRAGAGLL